MLNVNRFIVIGGLLAGGLSIRASVEGRVDSALDQSAPFAATAAQPKAQTTPNYAPILLSNLGSPRLITDDGTVVFSSNSNNYYGRRWHQGVVTELYYQRPSGSQFKVRADNRNGMVVVVFEYPSGMVVNDVFIKQVVVTWLPDSPIPVVLSVPIARASTWYDRRVVQLVEFKHLDDQNRIWANTSYEYATPEGNLVGTELAYWNAPQEPPTFFGNKAFPGYPSVILIGTSSVNAVPFGYYAPPISRVVPDYSVTFAGEFTNTLSFVPSRMNAEGWTLGKRNSALVLYRDGIEYPPPADNTIALLDDRNNLYNISRTKIWTTNPQTLVSTPENPATPFVALSARPMSLPDGYNSSRLVVPGDASMELGLVGYSGVTTYALFIPAELRSDANRDGEILVDRWSANPDRNLAEKRRPWYFWVNNDDDSGETDGSDIPGRGTNGQDSVVNGVRDLVDFFPVHLDIAHLLRIFPPDGIGISYRLTHAEGAANFLLTDLTPATAGQYQYDPTIAQTLGGESVTIVTASGVELDRAFLAKIATEDKGIILVEASKATTEPLHLEVWRDNVKVTEITLPMAFADVETMFRHKNLVNAVDMKPTTTDRTGAPNWPDELTNDQAFVFVHGYNVNQQQARGWQAEFFKRLWWGGSNAKFWGVTWYGYDSQLGTDSGAFTPNYQANVIHAFGTSPKLADLLLELRQPGSNIATVNVAGHSLGNMVVSSAISDHLAPVDRYFLLNAAVASEAYDAAETANPVAVANMPNTRWTRTYGDYPAKLRASRWYERFPSAGDERRRLTWRDRFAQRGNTAYYDLFSTGDHVLALDPDDTPELVGVLAGELANYLEKILPGQSGQPNGSRGWAYQEKLKGRTVTGKILGSNYGGWGFNYLYFKKSPSGFGKGPVMTPAVLRPNEITPEILDNVFTDEALREEPFFRPGSNWREVSTWTHDAQGNPSLNTERLGQLYGPTTGSAFAQRHRDALLARMIPAMSLVTGQDAVEAFTPDNSPSRSFDINLAGFRGQTATPPWPASRNGDTRWRHSDLRVVALPYVKKLYDKLNELGNLGQAAP